MTDRLIEKCIPHLVSDCLLGALEDLMTELEQTAEMRSAKSMTESSLMITCVIEKLLEVALQSARIVSWSDEGLYVFHQLREMIAFQKGLVLFYDHKMSEEEGMLCAYGQSRDDISGDFQLSALSVFQPGVYNKYIASLNDLITLHQTFEGAPLFAIATQGVRIGRTACMLTDILFSILGLDEKASKMRMLQFNFSKHIMIKQIVLKDRPIHRVDHNSEFRLNVWEHLQQSYGYTHKDVEFISDYTIWVIEDPFGDQGCIFAITNFDVTVPFHTPSEDTRIDFKYPYVIIQFIEVDKPFRRCGFASYLMNYIKREARANKFEILCVDLCSMNNTLPFWKALKFKESEYVERWYEFDLGK